MSRNWILITLVIVFITLGAVLFYLWGNIINIEPVSVISPTPTVMGLPDELAKDFDPTVNTPVFKILDADGSRKLLKLRMIFPERFLQKDITTSVTCEEQDIKVVKNGIEIATGSEAFYEAIEENSKEAMTLRGLCDYSSCEKINNECVLYVQ